jgi:phospholipid-transporting ATPase
MGNLCSGENKADTLPCGVRVNSENVSKNDPNRAFQLGPKSQKDLKSALPADVSARTTWARNTIKTSKYEWYNFIFLSLREQFQRTANYFFLAMCVLMLIGTYTNLFQSALNPWSTLGSVMIVMTCTMILQVWDDWGRHKNDHEINIRDAQTVDGKIKWQDIKVGQIMIVKNQESFPADLILLCSSELDGISYVETSNIDGETNLKIRSSPSEDLVSMIQKRDQIADLDTAIRNVKKLDATLDYLKPDPAISLEHFEGVLRDVKFGGVSISKPRVSLDKNHHMLRGATLRNTKWILGVVVYTGEETKLALNSSKNRGKLSNMEKVVNRLLYTVFAVMFVMVTVTDIGMLIWRAENFGSNVEGWWYLFPDGQDEGYDLPIWLAQWFTIAILYTNFVPLSMYVTMEFINFWHAKFINEDVEMYDEETDTRAHTRSFNLCAELGQVEYIFSDKTGTLTQNKMEFKMCTLDLLLMCEIYMFVCVSVCVFQAHGPHTLSR